MGEPIEKWTLHSQIHALNVRPITDAFLQRRSVGKAHPVHDFLFTYYTCSPQKLKQWVPSLKDTLVVDDLVLKNYPWLNDYWFKREENLLFYRKERMQKNVFVQGEFVANLCSQILNRPPRFGCFGLHEWAMVYQLPVDAIRHAGQRLRLEPADIAKFVESQKICCSHYDAYRFFTKEARPLNTLNPIFDTRSELEQGGCIHANMDLYKWAVLFWPWIGSDFILKTFNLALQARELDMRASPYDLSTFGYVPICIETDSGRMEYVREQQMLAEKSIPLRKELWSFCLSLGKP